MHRFASHRYGLLWRIKQYFFLLVVEKIFWIKNRAQNEVLPGSIFCNSAFSFTKLNRVYFAPREYFPGTKYVAEMNLLLKLYYIGRWKFRINIICIHTVMFDISPENISKIVKVMPRENNGGKSHFLLLRFLHVMIHRYSNNLRSWRAIIHRDLQMILTLCFDFRMTSILE